MTIIKQNIIDFFDSKAITWDSNNNHAEAGAEKIVNMFTQELSSKTVLDIGCGTGVLEDKIVKLNAKKITGIDISSKMVSIANKKFENNDNIEFYCTDILEFSPKIKYDIAIMYNVYPHLDKNENLVNKVYDLLSDNGLFIVAHGSGKDDINAHHKHHALEVSQQLKSANEESILWKSKFNIIESVDKKDIYYFYGKKIS